MNKKTYWVLSLDGGGIRGLYTSILLDKIEKHYKVRCNKLFDLVVGTSAGGLLALHIGQEECPHNDDLTKLFSEENAKTIFDKSYWDKILPIQAKPKYDGNGKNKVIKKNLDIKRFGDSYTKIAVVAYDIHSEKPKIFKSWEKEDLECDPCEIADATSAAPTYFPSVKIKNKWYIDGGVYANNPSLVALEEAQKLWGRDADIRVLSIGTCHEKSRNINGEDAEDWGAIRWVCNGLIDILMDAPRDAVNQYCKFALPGNKFLRLDGLISEEKMDDTSKEYRDELTRCANETYEKNKIAIYSFFSL